MFMKLNKYQCFTNSQIETFLYEKNVCHSGGKLSLYKNDYWCLNAVLSFFIFALNINHDVIHCTILPSCSLADRCVVYFLTEERISPEQPKRLSRDTKQQWHHSYLQVTEC